MQQQISKRRLVGDDAYPIFIMFEALYKRKFLDFNQGLDSVWENCVFEYAMFQGSQFNREDQSEYDCIHAYVRNLGEPPLTGYNGEPCDTTI